MGLEKFKLLSENQLQNAKKIIEKYYNQPNMSDGMIMQEIRNLARKEKLGTLDDGQELLTVQLEQELLK